METSNVTEPLQEDAKESGVEVPQQTEKNIKSPLGEEKTSNAKDNYLSGDAKKTLDFLQRVSDILQPSKEQTEKEKQEQWELIAKLESRKNEVFPDQWDEKLMEGRPQMKKILMNPKWRHIYNFQSLQSLLRVVRNLYNHYYEQNQEFKTEVGGHRLGLLQFFTSRFPNFVPCIFDVMRDQEDLADFYKPKDQIEEISRVIHEVNIGETFKRDKFPELEFEVYPQIAESPNFFDGGHQETDSDDTGGQQLKTKTQRKPMVSNDNIKIEPKQLHHIPNLPEDEADCQKIHINASDVSSWEEFSAQIRGHQVHELMITIGPGQINQVPAWLKDEVRCLKIHVKASDVSSWEELSAQIRGHQVDKLTVVIGPGQIAQIPASLKDEVSCIEIHVKASDVSSWEELSAQIQQTQGHQIESLIAPLTRQTTFEEFVAFIKLLKHVNRFYLLIYADLIKIFEPWTDTESFKLISDACTLSGTYFLGLYQEKNK